MASVKTITAVVVAVVAGSVFATVATTSGLGGDGIVAIRNGALTVGIDTAYGGAIALLVDNNNPLSNLINTHDMGRLVQQSYYSGPDPYRGGTFNNDPWPWNPISAGDRFGHRSTVLDIRNTSDWLYVKARPLQWALDNVACNCTFETNLTVDANGVFVRNRLRNHRYDKTVYPARDQELPAVYTVGTLPHLWTYSGDAPWTGGAVTEVSYPVPGPPWQRFHASEGWSAFTDAHPQKYGVGVLHAGVDTFLGGFAGQRGEGGPLSPNTGYQAPVAKAVLGPDAEYVFCFHLAIGYLDTIRGYFAERRTVPCRFD
uniref:Phospholipase B-like n=1 Tax=Neobodo designis TaxID=312471 RepID=A0A7S1Q3V9_NEODS|mmetsp:Transcript_3211/g.10010  ORF Transcript_3211/g.10010 Transcript_3211/m.10010 type:complete len:314 (+) Transcript_3211:29-970(+)